MSSGKSVQPYQFYPVRDSNSDEETLVPGALFQRQREKRRRYATTSDNSNATTSNDDERRRRGSSARASLSSAVAAPFVYSTMPTEKDWCRCGNCVNMPTLLEEKCCKSECLDLTYFQEDTFVPGVHCLLSSTVLLREILGKRALELQWFRQRRMQGHRGAALDVCWMTPANYRFTAYRNYIDFVHMYLGRHNRRVIPACVVNYIRETWSDPANNYVGYKEVEDMCVDEEKEEVPADELAQLLLDDGTM